MADNRRSSTRGLSGFLSLLGLALIFIGLVLSVLLSDIRLGGWLVAALGVVLIGAAFIIDFRKVGEAVTGKRGIFRVGTSVMVSIFFGITLLVNAISISNYTRFDTTGLSQFTLTSQTQDTLKKVEDEIKITIFSTPEYGILGDALDNFLQEYKNYSEKISVETVDPDQHPDQARAFGIYQYPTVVFQAGDKTRVVQPTEVFSQANNQLSADMEHPFTSAILEVTGITQKKIYFLSGHGESSVAGDLGAARQGLLDNLYHVDTIHLQISPAIPADASALVIAGPRQPLTSSELDIIREYLRNDGWLILMLNPNPPQQYVQLMSEWGIEIQDGTVIDPNSFVSPNIDSPLVSTLRNQLGFAETYFPGATAVIPQKDLPQNMIVRPLYWTGPDSWLDKNYSPDTDPVYEEGVDYKASGGSLALGALVVSFPVGDSPSADPEETTRIIVTGDSDFATNQHFYNGDNGRLFLNLVEVVTVGKQLINIERKVNPFRRMTVDQQEANFINISSIALLPILVVIAGGIVYWRRR